MKKSILIAILLFTFNSGMNAQIDRHTFMVGGNAYFQNSKSVNASESYNQFRFSPRVGYFMVDNFAIGVGLEFSAFNGSSVTNLTPFLRYYVKNFFLQGAYKYNTNYSAVQFDLGYAMFLNENVAIEPSFYFAENFDSDGLLGRNLGIQIGFQIYLNR